MDLLPGHTSLPLDWSGSIAAPCFLILELSWSGVEFSGISVFASMLANHMQGQYHMPIGMPA